MGHAYVVARNLVNSGNQPHVFLRQGQRPDQLAEEGHLPELLSLLVGTH